MVDEPICPTSYDDDVPAADDRFGVHGRIARTIEQVIEQTPGGKTIGLSGSWGSGKSTVVRLLQNAYAGRTDSRVIWTFDAWSHEGDPLRRTFLESLITTLGDHRWLVKSEWKEALDFLSRRRKVTEKRSAPRLTPLSVILGISVLLMPIGTTLFSNQIRNGITFGRDLTPDWLAILGLLLTLAPFIALVVWAVWLTTRPGAAATARRELVNALTVFVQRADVESRTETLDSGDPTSLEFDAVFTGIMSAALGSQPQRRLVLVIDNLDRVGAPQALAVWSTLQTFLQRRGSGGWIDQVWCVLPFDADAIQRLWPRDAATGNTVAESFLDKTFQLRFEVPPPRLANWKDYLLERLAYALPEHARSEELFRIYRLYSVRRTAATWGAPTPRQLKLFVNQIGALHRQWQHQIPLEDLAYYTLLQGERVDIIGQLLSGDLPTASEAGLVSDTVRDSLAALVYGAPVQDSHELLLRQPILEALETGDASRLDELGRISDKFSLVLALALEQGCNEWPHAEGGHILHAAAAIVDTNALRGETGQRIGALHARLRVAVRKAQAWAPMDARAVDGAISLVRLEPALARLLYDGFIAQRFAAGNLIAAQARDFAADYVRLVRGLGGVLPRTRLDVANADTYIEIARALAQDDPDGGTWSHFGPASPGPLDNALRENVAPGWGNVVRVAASAGVSHLPDVIAKARTGLKESDDATPAQQVEMLAALHALANAGGNAEAGKVLDDLTDAFVAGVHYDRPAERAFERALKALGPALNGEPHTAHSVALGAWLYTLLARQGSVDGIRHSRRGLESPQEQARQWLQMQVDSAAPGLCRSVAQAAMAFGDGRTLFKVAGNEAERGGLFADRIFVVQVLTMMAELGAPPRVLPPSVILDEWDAPFPAWSRYSLARAMRSQRREIADAMIARPFESRLASSYAGALDAHPTGDEGLLSLCAENLPAVPAEAWRTSLSSGEHGLPVLHAALARRGKTLALAPDVREVVSEFVTNPAENQWTDPDTAAAIMGTFPDLEREEIVGRVLEALIKHAESRIVGADDTTRAWASSTHLLAAFAGPALLDATRLRARPELFGGVAAYIVDSGSDDRLTSLSALVRAEPALVQRLAANYRSFLRRAITRQQSRRTSEYARAALSGLSEMLGTETPLDEPGLQTT